MSIIFGLHLCAAVQIGIATLNLFLPRLMGWKSELAKGPLLIREVFYVHSWFISLTLVLFAVLTLRFTPEMRAPGLGAWLATGIGVFWLTRTAIQVVYYSSSHWLGKSGLTMIHMACLAVYGGMATAYLMGIFL